ncbi:MAG TPA: SDR family oxidoreductase [Bacteroidota bacterium]|nr:SDR family oxidoreductase [Bacteroidota bacterium]
MSSSRKIWITGASSGIGRALAMEYASQGDTVAATARNIDALDSLRADIEKGGGRCLPVSCDVTDADKVQQAAGVIVAGIGLPDVLVNNAGVTYFKDFMSTTIGQFDEVVATNLRGLFLVTKSVLPGMLERGSGTILNILSYAAKATYTGSSVYAASKAGAEAMMNVLRAETRGKGIKIINVYPGAVQTPIWHQRHIEKYGHQMMKAAEIAKAIYSLSCQPDSMILEDVVIRPQSGDLQV